MKDIQIKTANTIRILSAEAIEKAKSGHPGMCLGAAPIGLTTFMNMTFNPKDPSFFNRDRFILSAGHASMLQYSLLHLFGYKVSLEDIKNFRQLGSITSGHPEYKVCPGVEVTTGPLGQGIANAVGMAMAEAFLAKRFNQENFDIVDHYTFALCGDGCMQEGMENEASSLAGTLKLGKLIVIYDRNCVTIEGKINNVFNEDVGARHKALGWQVINVDDANNMDSIAKAIKKAKAEKEKPSLIIVSSHIGFGSPLEGSEKSHGAPIGEDNIKALKEKLNWKEEPFTVPKDVYAFCHKFANKGKKAEKAWKALFEEYANKFPQKAKEFNDFMSGKLPDLISQKELWEFEKDCASRDYSNIVLNKLSDIIPNLIGGSADLAPANKTTMKDKGDFSAENREGRNLHFGIREHAMSAIVNGMYLHGGLRPFCATFAVFSDYMKNAIRMAAIMNLPVFYIFTHDSIGVGEDGPTHQPIEHLVSLRATPNLKVFRPADGKETTCAYISALTGKNPTALLLSRQTLPRLENSSLDALKGGYVLDDCNGKPDLIIMATGSEVILALEAKKVLANDGVNVRVVSMPCLELFDEQPKKYRDSVLLPSCKKRLAVEAGATTCWYKYVGLDGKIIGIDTFGVSAPAKVVFNHFGFNVENVVDKAKSLVK